jgi:sarcosine oxidase gamma subunit
VLSTIGTQDQVALRLTPNDFQLLCQPGQEQALLEKLDSAKSTVTDSTGALACFALGGPRRDEVLERSTAVDLRRDKVVPGSVIQLTIHTIHCTLYRTENLEILTHSRTLSESLYDGLMDVGMGVGLVPAGLGTIPVSFEKEK